MKKRKGRKELSLDQGMKDGNKKGIKERDGREERNVAGGWKEEGDRR
jgi:hypothetical protein